VRITLFIPCFVDQLTPEVGAAMVKVLERLGHEVEFPAGQTCCGQPAFNTGFWDEAREAAAHALDVFRGAETVVAPSGSCTAMMKVYYPVLFRGTPREGEAAALSARTHEFSDFLVSLLGVRDVGAKFSGRAVLHGGCHSLRELGVRTPPRELLERVKGLELVGMEGGENCCGFGGTFAVKHHAISGAMGRAKAKAILASGADCVVSNDPSCLLQIKGVLEREGGSIRTLHLAEVLVNT